MAILIAIVITLVVVVAAIDTSYNSINTDDPNAVYRAANTVGLAARGCTGRWMGCGVCSRARAHTHTATATATATATRTHTRTLNSRTRPRIHAHTHT